MYDGSFFLKKLSQDFLEKAAESDFMIVYSFV